MNVLNVPFTDLLKDIDVQISTTPTFGDFLWDGDLHLQEITALPAAFVVDSSRSARRVVIQSIRNEIRYWLTTNRDPAMIHIADMELGVLRSWSDAAALCREFLTTDARGALLHATRERRDRPHVDLEVEFRDALSSTPARDRYLVDASYPMALLASDADVERPATSDGTVVVDAMATRRRVLLQREGGEIRYWLRCDRDADIGDGDEFGSLTKIEDAVHLCHEFLISNTELHNLVTTRVPRR